MPVSDSEYRAALTRAGDASAAEAVACRERDEARCDLRRTAAALLEARAVIRAACAALGASATGDLAADVAREVAAHGATHGAYQSALAGRDKAKRALASEEAERAAAEATLRETQHALARVRSLIEWECTAREEAREGLRSLLAGWDAIDGVWLPHVSAARALVASWSAAPVEAAAPLLAMSEECSVCQSWTCDGSEPHAFHDAALMEPVEAAAVEAPHRVGDTWRRGDERAEVTSVDVDNAGSWLRFATRGSTYANAMEANGWRRVRCAPAVGDAVQTAGGDGAKAGEFVALAGEE